MAGCSEIFVKIRPFGENERTTSPSRRSASTTGRGLSSSQAQAQGALLHPHLIVDEGARQISLMNPNTGHVSYGPGTFDEVVDESDPFAAAFPGDRGNKDRFRSERIARRVVDRITARKDAHSCSPVQNVIVAYGQTGSGKTHTVFGPDFLSQSIMAQQHRYTSV